MSSRCCAGNCREAPFRLIPDQVRGRVLAIGSGLALGREGPSVQMGSSIGDLVGRMFRRKLPDCRVLLAAGAGAGLATAFNAPIAGAIFVLEELVQQLRYAHCHHRPGSFVDRHCGGAHIPRRCTGFPCRAFGLR